MKAEYGSAVYSGGKLGSSATPSDRANSRPFLARILTLIP